MQGNNLSRWVVCSSKSVRPATMANRNKSRWPVDKYKVFRTAESRAEARRIKASMPNGNYVIVDRARMDVVR